MGLKGTQVVIPFRGEEKSYDHLKTAGDLGYIVPVRWDSRHKASIIRAMEYSNVVINLVGRNRDTRSFTMEETQIDAAALIAEVCHRLTYSTSFSFEV